MSPNPKRPSWKKLPLYTLLAWGLTLTACAGDNNVAGAPPQQDEQCSSCVEEDHPSVDGLWSRAAGRVQRYWPAAHLQMNLELYGSSSARASSGSEAQGIVPVPRAGRLEVEGTLDLQALQLYCPNNFMWFETWYLIEAPAGTYTAQRTLEPSEVISNNSFQGGVVEFKNGWEVLTAEFHTVRLDSKDQMSGFVTISDRYGCSVSVNVEPHVFLRSFDSGN